MLGAYFCGAALIAATVRPILVHRLTKTVFASSAAAILVATALASASMPPAATGPFLIGRFVPEWQLLASKIPPYRAPQVEFWYPVDKEVPHPSKSANTLYALEQFFFTGESGLPDHPLSDAPIAEERRPFPVLLYFSGGAGEGIDNVYLIRELVSQGFVVAAVYYPLELPGLSSEDLERRIADLTVPLLDFSSKDGFEMDVFRLNNRVGERAEDASSVLSALTTLYASGLNGLLRRNLDTTRVGIFGFSFGGAVAAEAKYHDERFTAALNLDGWHFGEAVKYGVQAPYMFMVDDDPPAGKYEATLDQRQLDGPIAAMKHHGGYFLTISGTHHMNFADSAFHCFLLRRMPLGPIDPDRAFQIISSYTVMFFEAYLKDMPLEGLISATPIFYDVHLQRGNNKPRS